MSRIYDNWEKLVGAVLRREKDRQIALFQSFSSSSSAAVTSRFSFDSSHEDVCNDFNFNPFAGDDHVPAVRKRVLPQQSGFCNLSEATSTLTVSSNFFLRDAMVIEYEEIIKATQDFRLGMILEKGGSATVYKGWIDELNLTAVEPGFGTAVAVLKVENEGQFVNELYYSSELRHPNLVKHIGYCFNSNNIILVYEFISGGSLYEHLFTGEHELLHWAARIKVALGAARALAFLHNLEIPVIHRDFKSANILLDDNFNAKLSDFGLAIDVPDARLSTAVVGTYGYVAPEYLATGYSTTRCDVYGFGVVLSELLFGLQVLDISRPKENHNLMDWAKPYLRDEKRLSRVMDNRLEGQYPRKEAYKVAKIALQCVASDPSLRPTMAEIVASLEQM